MDKLKAFILENQSKIAFLFYAGAGLGAFNCLTRPDFNLFLYIYLIYIWSILENKEETKQNEKINSFFFLIFSLLIDFIWVFFWGSKWSKIKHDYERSIHGLVILMSWIAIFLKIFVIFAVGLIEWSTISRSFGDNLTEKLNQNNNFVKQKDEI